MAKKIFMAFAVIVLSLCCSVCFASEGGNNSNVNLGEEITDSLNKTGNSVRNVADDVMNGGKNNTKNDNNNRNNNNHNARSMTNGTGYNAVRTSVEDVANGNANMSTTTWVWIILAVAAIVIVAMVWYYAVQDNNRD